MTTTDTTFTAEFKFVRDAQAFELRLNADESAWRVVPGTLKRKGRVVTWKWNGIAVSRTAYFQDMLEAVGYYGSVPTGHKATLNGLIAPASY